MEYDLNLLWKGATDRKIQQIREEWEWLIVNVLIPLDKKLNILEIGSYDGGSSWYLNQFAKNMITIDDNNPCRFNPSEFGEYYQYFYGDSHDPKWTNVFEKPWDFVFIDGDHSYEGVKADFCNISPFLEKGTPVAFHDIVMSDYHHTHGCYVGEFWEDLKREYKATRVEEFKTNAEWAGIGVIWT